MANEYFVIIAGQPKQEHSEILLVTASSSRNAHIFSDEVYRKRYKLKPDIYIHTQTAFRSDDEAKAKDFMDKLLELMKSEKHAQTKYDFT